MITVKKRIGSNRSRRATYISLASLCLLLAVTLSAQAPKTESKSGIVRQLSEVRFPAGEGPDCLQFFLENGDMKTGPSTAIMLRFLTKHHALPRSELAWNCFLGPPPAGEDHEIKR